MIPFTVAVYLFQAKNMIWLSILTEFFTTYVFSSGCKKPKEQHIHDHVCTYHSKNYQHSMRDVTQPTNNTAHVTDPNNAQPPRHGVIKRTMGGSLVAGRPRCRAAATATCCCYWCWACLLLLRMSLCCRCFFCCVRFVETFVCFMCAHSTHRALAYVNAQPPRHGIIKRTIRRSLARSRPPPLPGRRRCYVLLLLLVLGLSDAAASTRCAVLACTVCVFTYVRMELSRVS